MKRTTIRTLAFLMLLVGAGTTLGACNTVEGVGEDVSAAGKGVSRAAKKTKDAM